VTHQLAHTFRQALQNVFEPFGIEKASFGETEEMCGPIKLGLAQSQPEAASEPAHRAPNQVLLQNARLRVPRTTRKAYRHREFLQRASDAGDPEFLCQPDYDSRNTGQNVDVFVPIKVCRDDARPKHFDNLLLKFDFDLAQVDAAGDEPAQELARG
jgi:hypothetical protein